MSSLFQLLGGGGGSWINILLQAVGCAMRGESPQKFMKNLANSHPQLKKMNLDDLMGTAEQLAQEKGYNIEDVKSDLDQRIGQYINK